MYYILDFHGVSSVIYSFTMAFSAVVSNLATLHLVMEVLLQKRSFDVLIYNKRNSRSNSNLSKRYIYIQLHGITLYYFVLNLIVKERYSFTIIPRM